jgi:nitrite reductase (NADH) large subunit
MDTDPSNLSGVATCMVCATALGSVLREMCPVCGARQTWLNTMPNVVGSQQPPRSNPSPRTFVIIGSGIAALRAAETIRANDTRSQVVMITREPCLPYHRLNLTRYLDGLVDAASTMLHSPGWYASQGIEVRLETDAIHIDPHQHVVRTRTREVAYDRLVIATGARVAVPPIPNIWIAGILPVRTLFDCARILETAGVGRRVVILGGGVLGVETAVALRRRGCDVVLVESGETLMGRQLDVTAARLLQQRIEQLGVRVLLSSQAVAIEGDETVEGIRLGHGDFERADRVLLATGIVPNVSLARGAGLKVNRGVVVDDTMQTSDSDIYAAGDVVEHRGEVQGAWATAMEMGSVAGGNAAGGAEMFVPLVRTSALKVVEIDLCTVGRVCAERSTERELAHSEDAGAIYQKVVLDAGRIVGCVLLGDTQPMARVREAIRNSTNVSSAVNASGSLREFLASL